jgi:tRNA G46 methylase TrmB
MSDGRQHAPATVRNRDFILNVLRDVLAVNAVIFEIASGSGEHIVHFCETFPGSGFPTSGS